MKKRFTTEWMQHLFPYGNAITEEGRKRTESNYITGRRDTPWDRRDITLRRDTRLILGYRGRAFWDCKRLILECLGEEPSSRKGMDLGHLRRNKYTKYRHTGKSMHLFSTNKSPYQWGKSERRNRMMPLVLFVFMWVLSMSVSVNLRGKMWIDYIHVLYTCALCVLACWEYSTGHQLLAAYEGMALLCSATPHSIVSTALFMDSAVGFFLGVGSLGFFFVTHGISQVDIKIK